jgi:hypothetical protein
LSAAAIGGFVRAASDAQQTLANTARAIDITATSLKALQLVTAETGGNVGALDNALLNAQKNLGLAAAGTGEARKIIEALGLDIAQLRALAPDQLFLAYAEAIGKLSDRNEQIVVSNALFGKSANEILNTIRAGRPAFEEAAAAVERLGLVLRPEQVSLISQAGDAFGRLREGALAFGARLAASVAPFVIDFARNLTGAADSAVKVQAAIDAFVDTAVTGFQLVLNGANSLKAVFFGIAGALATVAGFTPGIAFTELGRSLRAAAEENFSAARAALENVKSLEQIQSEILRIRSAAETQAAAAQTNAAANLGTIGIGEGQIQLPQFQIAPLEQLEIELQQRLILRETYAALELAEVRRQYEAQSQLAAEVAAFEISQRESVVASAIGLLNVLGQKSRAAAIAAILLNRGLAIAQAIQNTAVAFTKALAIDPTGRTAARVALLGKIQIGIIAATGALEVANVASGDRGGIGNTGLGTPTNPLPVAPVGGEATARAQQRGVTQIFMNGFMTRDMMDELLARLRDDIDRDIVVIPGNSLQAQLIRGG